MTHLMAEITAVTDANIRYSDAAHQALMALNEISWRQLDPADQKRLAKAKKILRNAIDPSGILEDGMAIVEQMQAAMRSV